VDSSDYSILRRDGRCATAKEKMKNRSVEKKEIVAVEIEVVVPWGRWEC
jgi:hypothetical protein